jgi:LPS-assembly protein
MRRPRWVVWLVMGLALAGPAAAWARSPGCTSGGAVPTGVTVPTGGGGEVTIFADRLEHVGPDDRLVATGNVEVLHGRARLTADRVEFNRVTGDTLAEGRVTFQDGEDRLTGRLVTYNVRTGSGVVHEGEARVAPYYRLAASRMERIDPGHYAIRDGIFTTCDDDPPAWSLRFGSAEAELDRYLVGRDVSFWVKNIPLLPWVPFLVAPIRQERATGLLFPRLGVSSTRGPFVEQPFYWAISDSQDATVTLDVYGKRGLGAELEYRYLLSEAHRGALRGFYINEFLRDDPPPGIDRNRGWWGLRHDWIVGPRLFFRADVNGVSDDFLIQEYGDFLAERRREWVESNVFLTRTWSAWNAVGNLFWYQDLTTRQPVELHRLPDIRVQAVRQPVPGIPGLLYELEARGTHFVRDLGSDGTRLDLHPRLSRPVPLWGSLTLTPFVGGRLTGFDRRVVGMTVVNGIPVEITEDDVRLRSAVEVGSDLQARAARAYGLGGRLNVDAVLHSIEPRVSYTRASARGNEQLPDWVEPVLERGVVTYSLTNRVLARTIAPEGTEAVRWEAARFAVGHTLEPEREERRLGNVTADLLLAPNGLFQFRGAASYNVHDARVDQGITDLAVTAPRFRAAVGTRFSEPGVNFLQGSVVAELTRNLVGRAGTEWDVRTNTPLENRVGFDLRLDCWGFSIEYVRRHRDEDAVRFSINLIGLGAPLATAAAARPDPLGGWPR